MEKGFISDISGTGKLGILLLTIVVSTLIFGFLGLVFANLFTGIGLDPSSLTDFSKPDTITYMRIMQIFQAIGLFIIPPIIALFLFQKKNENYLSFKPSKIVFIGISASIMILALPIINWLAEFNQSLTLPESFAGLEQWMHESELAAESITKYFLEANGIPMLLFNLFIMALIPAFGEEMLFRGVLQKIFTQMSNNIHIGIWITAFLFSAIHMQFFTFLPRFFMGAMFGYLLVWSGSIWLPITAHFINNGTAVIVNYLISKGIINPEIETIGNENYFYILGSILLVGSGMYYIQTNSKVSLE